MEKGDEQKRIRKRKMIEGIERRDDTRKETNREPKAKERETRKKESDKKEGVNARKRSRRRFKRK